MKFWKLASLFYLAVSIYILWQIRQVVLLAFTAIVFATVLNAPVRKLQKAGLKQRGLAVIFFVVIGLAVLTAIFLKIVPSVSNQWQQWVDIVPAGIEQLQDRYEWLQIPRIEKILLDIKSVREVLNHLQNYGNGVFSGFFTVFSNSVDFLLNFLLVVVVTLMLLFDPRSYKKAFLSLFPYRHKPKVARILDLCEESLLGWFIGILFNMTVIVALSGIGLWLLRVQLPIVNALIAGLLTFIPNVGPVMSVIPPAAIALLDAPWKAGAVIGLYIAIQQIESNVLTPIVMKREVSLLPAVTLLSQVTFGFFFGFLGLFLALPLVVVIKVLIQELWIERMMPDIEDNREKILEENQELLSH
ncbi:AI-2E family transporter [Oscillatoriales cyanobacterium LEGE 11467]|uniref:AI-2E family transporter n=1 Tax=Zarconia navalis LEGE 11467 TaxID=1828826 RepID=A0A928W1C5_9CYAN|nr:AI-2E family transporter [Zarconia navalis]MBE9042722.1 AI-2E family transporter [Zarconia navalis LEGE 11467]